MKSINNFQVHNKIIIDENTLEIRDMTTEEFVNSDELSIYPEKKEIPIFNDDTGTLVIVKKEDLKELGKV